jgi:hypothetical protein
MWNDKFIIRPKDIRVLILILFFLWSHVLSAAFVIVHVTNNMYDTANINMTNIPCSKRSIPVNPNRIFSQ